MSRSWRNQLNITLATDSLKIELRGRFGRGLLARHAVALPPGGGEDGWRPSLRALGEWLEGASVRYADLNIVLCDSFARYLAIPWAQLSSLAEVQALSRARYEDVFGAAAAGWEIRADLGDYQAGGIACALSREMLSSLNLIGEEHQVRLRSVVTRFAWVTNNMSRQIPENAVLVVSGAHQCVIACRMQGHWHSIRNLRFGAAGDRELALLVHREMLLQGMPLDTRLYVQGARCEDLAEMLAAASIPNDVGTPSAYGAGPRIRGEA